MPTRNASGFQLVEMIVSLGVVSILMAGIVESLALVQRAARASQNHAIASIIAQEMIDEARNQTWTTLNANIGTITLLVNRTASGQTGPSYLPRPLLLDLANNTYSDAGQNNLFRGTVQQVLALAGSGQLRLTVTVSWPTENSPGQTSTLTMTTVISEYGIHN